MDKAPDAFRTISEVAEVLDTPAHVLRFWESRFPQIRPVKRAGGRRYYRPADVALLAGIRHLLHDQGLTIRGVQKVLRENGVRHVQSLSPGAIAGFAAPSEAAEIEAALDAEFLDTVEPERLMLRPEAQVVPLPRPPRATDAAARMLAEAPPPANAAHAAAADEVPEAPFIEAEEEPVAPAEPVPLRRGKRAPAVEDELPLLARMEDAPTAEDLQDLAASDGVTLDGPALTEAAEPGDLPVAKAPPEPQEAAEPESSPAPPLAARLRALHRPLTDDRALVLAEVLARARALRARMAPPRSRG